MIAKTVKPAIMKVQADNREELVALIEAAEGFQQVGKIAKMSGVYVANLVQADYALPIYAADQQGGGTAQQEASALTADEAAAYNTAKGLTEGQEGYVSAGDPKPADFDKVVNQ